MKNKRTFAEIILSATKLAPAVALILLFNACVNKVQHGTEPKKETAPPADFIPGGSIIWAENFSNAAIGDFPANWNTNATAEVVEVPGVEKKALMLQKDGVYIPLAAKLPQNFTLEFNLYCNGGFSYYSAPFQVLFASLASKKEFTVLKQYNPHNKDVVKIWLHPDNAAETAGYSGFEQIEKGTKQVSNEVNTSLFFAHKLPASAKIVMWKQDARLRVYVNEEKLWDLPQAFDQKINFNSLVFSLSGIRPKPGDRYFVSDFKLKSVQ